MLAIARAAAKQAGRDPDTLEITSALPDDVTELDALRRLRVNRVLVPTIRGARLNPPMRGPEDIANWAETIKRYAVA